MAGCWCWMCGAAAKPSRWRSHRGARMNRSRMAALPPAGGSALSADWRSRRQPNPQGFGEALAAGTYQVWAVVETSLSGLKHMITGAISTCNLSGPIGIAETSGAMASQGAESFIRFIAVLSTAVGPVEPVSLFLRIGWRTSDVLRL